MSPALARPTADVLPTAVRAALATLRAGGHRALLVGGCVRDLLRGVAVADFDVATDAEPTRVLALFPRAIPTGIRHGTVMVPIPGAPSTSPPSAPAPASRTTSRTATSA